MAFIPQPVLLDQIPPEERFSSEKLAAVLRDRGVEAFFAVNTDELLDRVLGKVKEGDVILVMSNGAFDNIHERLLKALRNTRS